MALCQSTWGWAGHTKFIQKVSSTFGQTIFRQGVTPWHIGLTKFHFKIGSCRGLFFVFFTNQRQIPPLIVSIKIWINLYNMAVGIRTCDHSWKRMMEGVGLRSIKKLFKWVIQGLFFFIFVFSPVHIVHVHYKISPMTGFEPRTSKVRSDRFTNWDTTTAQKQLLFLRYFTFENNFFGSHRVWSPEKEKFSSSNDTKTRKVDPLKTNACLWNKPKAGAGVVAQFAKLSVLIPEVHGSNPVIGKKTKPRRSQTAWAHEFSLILAKCH